MRRTSLPATAFTCIAGVTLGMVLLAIMGLGNGGQLFGIPLRARSPGSSAPTQDPADAITAECDSRGLTLVAVDHSRDRKRKPDGGLWLYSTRITVAGDDGTAEVGVVLDWTGRKWELAEWRTIE